MKILYDHQIFIRQKRGGISRYFYEIIRRAAVSGDIGVWLHQGFHINVHDMKPLATSMAGYSGGRHSKIYKSGPALTVINRLLMKNWLRKIEGEFDVYHPTYYGILTARAKKTVVTLYDMIHEKFPQHLRGAAAFTENKRKIIERADAVIAISENTKKDAVDFFGINPERIRVIHLAASDAFYPPSDEEKNEFRKKREIRKPYIVYVGERGGYKNFPILLAAVSKLRGDHGLDVVAVGGSGVPSRSEKEILRSTGLFERVRFVGGVNDGDLRMYYACAEMHAVTSLYEGFGITPLEAMQSGTPVVAPRCSSIPEVVGDAGLYYGHLDAEELSSRIESVAHDNALRGSLVAKGLERSRSFGWEKTAAATFGLYKEIAN